jgi:hypothetical protein
MIGKKSMIYVPLGIAIPPGRNNWARWKNKDTMFSQTIAIKATNAAKTLNEWFFGRFIIDYMKDLLTN